MSHPLWRVARLTALAALALAAGCARGCSAPNAQPAPLLYVSDEAGGRVAVVDPATAQVVARIAVGKRPRGLKLSRDGRWLYVALSGSLPAGPGVDESKLPPPDRTADGIGVVDVARRALVRTLESGQDPETFDLSPDGATLYISNEETAELSALDLATGKIRGRAHVGDEPEGVTLHPGGKIVFVTSEADNEVTAVDVATLTAIAHIPTAPRPRSIVITDDGATGFATDEGGGAVTVFDAIAWKPLGEIKVHEDSPMPSGPRPMGAVLSHDGKLLYVSCGRGGSIAVIDVATRAQVRSIDGVGDRAWGIALSADGKRLYTANGTSHDLSIVDLATGNVDKRVQIGGLPWGVALAR
jgi:YVTN family beta-propeller protein